MHLTLTDYLLWGTTTLLNAVVCLYAFRRRSYIRLPMFTAFITLLLVRTPGLRWVSVPGPGYTSPLAFTYYWVTLALLLVVHAAAIVEIARCALRDYRGVWALGWRVLSLTAFLAVLYAAVDAHANAHSIAMFILSSERGLELTASVVLMMLLLLCAYYLIRPESVVRLVAVGLCFYSAVQVLNNTLLHAWPTRYFPWGSAIRQGSFVVSLLIWIHALRKPLAVRTPGPELLPQQVYDRVAPQVNYRLRALNDRLREVLRS